MQLDAVSTRHLDDAKYALGEGNMGMAIAFADSVLKRAPESTDAHFLRGQVLARSNKMEEAVQAFEKTLEIDPAYPAVWFNLANIDFKKYKFKDAVGKYEQEAMVQEKQLEKYGKAYSVRYRETMSRLNLQKGRAHRQLGEHELATAAFREAIALDANNAEGFADLSQILREDGKNEEALRQAQKALNLVPDHPDYEYMIGALKHELGKSEEALPHLQKALQKKPWFAPARYSYGQVLVQMGEEEAGALQLVLADTLQVLDKRLERARFNAQTFPDDYARWLELGQLFIQMGRVDEALRPFYLAQSLRPDDLSIQNDIANITLIRGDTLEAVQLLDRMLADHPTFTEGWYNLGVIHALQNQYADAAEAWRKTLELNPSHVEAKQNLEKIAAN